MEVYRKRIGINPTPVIFAVIIIVILAIYISVTTLTEGEARKIAYDYIKDSSKTNEAVVPVSNIIDWENAPIEFEGLYKTSMLSSLKEGEEDKQTEINPKFTETWIVQFEFVDPQNSIKGYDIVINIDTSTVLGYIPVEE